MISRGMKMETEYGTHRIPTIRDDQLFEEIKKLQKKYETHEYPNYYEIHQTVKNFGYHTRVYGQNCAFIRGKDFFEIQDCGVSKHDGIWDGSFRVKKQHGKPKGWVGKRRKDETEEEFDERLCYIHQS